MTTPASEYLTERAVTHQVFVHDGKVASIGQAAAERNQKIEQVVRSLVFRIKAGEYVMVLTAGMRQINWKAIRTYYSQSRISMPDPEELIEVTGYEPGTVNPFGLKTALPVLVDHSVNKHKVVSLGSGVRGTAIIMKVEDLLAALGDPPLVGFTEK